MKLLNPRIEHLKTMMSLEGRRSALQHELEAIQLQLATLQRRLFDDNFPAPKSRTILPAKNKIRAGRRARRGALSESILAALSSAGDAGIRVRDLAAALGAKAVNIHAWFQSTAKRHPAIKKVAAGTYRLDGNGTALPASPAPTKAKRGAVAKPGKVAGRKKPTGKRGALAEKILKVLGEAGESGISIKDIAEKIGSEYRNVSIWFATTGKKNAGIQKLGPARYKLTA